MELKETVEFVGDDSVMFEMVHDFEGGVGVVVLIFAKIFPC